MRISRYTVYASALPLCRSYPPNLQDWTSHGGSVLSFWVCLCTFEINQWEHSNLKPGNDVILLHSHWSTMKLTSNMKRTVYAIDGSIHKHTRNVCCSGRENYPDMFWILPWPQVFLLQFRSPILLLEKMCCRGAMYPCPLPMFLGCSCPHFSDS